MLWISSLFGDQGSYDELFAKEPSIFRPIHFPTKSHERAWEHISCTREFSERNALYIKKRLIHSSIYPHIYISQRVSVSVSERNALYIPLYIPPYIPTYTFPNVWVWVWVCVCVCARVYVYLFGFVRIWVLLKSFQHLTSTHACAHVQMHTCSMAYRWTRCASHTRTRTHAWKDRERDTTWQVLVGYVFLLHVYIYTHTHTTCTCVYMYIYIHTHTLQDQCSLATCFPYA